MLVIANWGSGTVSDATTPPPFLEGTDMTQAAPTVPKPGPLAPTGAQRALLQSLLATGRPLEDVRQAHGREVVRHCLVQRWVRRIQKAYHLTGLGQRVLQQRAVDEPALDTSLPATDELDELLQW